MFIFVLKYVMNNTSLMVVVKAASLESAQQLLENQRVFVADAKFDSILSQFEDKPVEMPIAICGMPWR